METLFNILNYVYQTKNMKLLDASISDFFNDGNHFPEFVSMIYNKPIPKLKKKLFTFSDFKNNFKRTIEFLVTQDSSFKKYKYSQKPHEMELLLLDIFTKVCFPMSIDEIFRKSNLVLKSKNLHFNNADEIFCGKFLLSLLNVLTNGKVQMVKHVNEKADFNKLIIPSLEKANVPICIDQDSFEYNHNLFLIQIQIIFSVFAENSKPEIINAESEDSFSFYEDSSHELFQGRRGSSMRSSTPKFSLSRQEAIKKIEANESAESEPILESGRAYVNDSFINAINFFINDPSKSIKSLNDLFIPNSDILIIFVSKVVNEDIHIDGSNHDEKLNQMYEYLSKRDKNFSKSEYILTSRKNWLKFIKYLFQSSFFTDEKTEIIKKQCNSIFYDYQINVNHLDEFITSNGSLFLPLIQRVNYHNYRSLKRNIYPPSHDFTFENLHELFDEFNIPFLLDDKSLTSLTEIQPILLQIKVILDRLDSNYLNKRVNEYIQNISQINVEEPPLLMAINAIGSRNGIRFNEIESVIDGAVLPLFVETLLNKSLSTQIQINNSMQLTDKESEQNIENIIQYLKTQKNKFRILLFDFKDPEKKESSTILLCKNLLDIFLVKSTRKEILERCNGLIGSKFHIQNINDFARGDAFLGLLHFLKHANIHFTQYDFHHLTFDDIKERFKDLHIPLVINSKCIDDPKANEDFIYYQLQFYFDRLDLLKKFNPPLRIVEKILISLKALSKINLLDYKQLPVSIRAKNAYSKYKKDKSETNVQSFQKKRKKAKTDDPISLDIISHELNRCKNAKEAEMNNPDIVVHNEFDSFADFNPYDILFKRYSVISLKIDHSYNDGMCSIQPLSEQKKSSYLKMLNEDLHKVKDRASNTKKFPPNSSHFADKLYKIYYYDDEKKRWEFNSNDYNDFLKAYNLGYPKLDDDQIYVYALAHNYSLYGASRDEIKPIFLLLHVPKCKETTPTLTTIVTQIYSYLYSISNLRIIFIDSNRVYDQIKSTQIINKIASNLNIQTVYDSKLLFFVNSNVSTYDSKNNDALNKGNLYSKLKKTLPDLRLIPIDFKSNYSTFHDCIIDLTSQFSPITSYDILLRLQQFPQYQISGLYIKMKMQPSEDTEKILEDVIKDRYQKLVSRKAPNPYLFLLDEFYCFTPEGDVDFNQIYRYIIYKNFKESNDSNIKLTITNKLCSIAEKQINNLKTIIESKLFWENKEISIIKNSFSMFLDKAFYDIIVICDYGRVADLIYEDYIDILENQKKKNLDEINSLFAVFFSKIDERNKQMERDLREDIKKSTRYIMKEVENVRDVEVVVSFNGNIEKLIPQDF